MKSDRAYSVRVIGWPRIACRATAGVCSEPAACPAAPGVRAVPRCRAAAATSLSAFKSEASLGRADSESESGWQRAVRLRVSIRVSQATSVARTQRGGPESGSAQKHRLIGIRGVHAAVRAPGQHKAAAQPRLPRGIIVFPSPSPPAPKIK